MTDNYPTDNYMVANNFMVRVPLLPLSILDEISREDLPDVLLRKYFAMPLVQAALFLASPGICRAAVEWLQGDDAQKDNIKLKRSLLKYLTRMSSRCTPFGLFAGIATANFGDRTEMQIQAGRHKQLFLRPDMQYLCSLASRLSADKSVKENLLYFPNSSLFAIGGEYRYVEYYTDKDGIRKYQLQSTTSTESLETVLSYAKGGNTADVLSEAITGNGIGQSDAQEYVNTLIENQVLVSSIEPRVSGQSYLIELLKYAEENQLSNRDLEELKIFQRLISKAENEDDHNLVRTFQSILQMLDLSGTKYHEGSIIQADMKVIFREAQLSKAVANDIADVLPVLMKFSRGSENALLDKFRENFSRRYDMDEIPLSLALDAELGPGYIPDGWNSVNDPLIDGLLLQPPKPENPMMPRGPVDQYLYGKLQHALISGAYELVITETDLKDLPDNQGQFPPSFSLLGKIIGNCDENTGKRIIQIDSAGGSSAANLAGRFCYMDGAFTETLKQITGLEQKAMGDVILAEVVHLPQQRTGNILMRPVLRDFEIPYLARPAVEEEFAIQAEDIMVSVKGGKIILRSKRLNKYILPRLSNAHNYAYGALPVYRFLCDLQTQSACSNLSFSWGPLEHETIRLPRVVYKNFVLQAACWNISGNELGAFLKAREDRNILEVAGTWRTKYLIPEEVLISSGDNELWINLSNIECLRLMQHEAKRMKTLSLKEFIKHGDDCMIRSGNEMFANECVFFIHRKI